MAEILNRISKFKQLSTMVKMIMIMISFFVFSLFYSIYGQSTIAETSLPEVGLWTTKEEDGVFQIYQCEQNLCGKFVGMQYKTAMPPINSKGHSQCNYLILRNMVRKDNSKYWIGKVSDPRDEKIYDAKVWLKNKDELHLRGYMGISLFGETQIWHRYHGYLGKNCRIVN